MNTEAKRGRADQVSAHGSIFRPAPKKAKVAPSANGSPASVALAGQILKIQQAKQYALEEAHQDGCTGNFRIFDSPFGNFLLPAIPTRAELCGRGASPS